MGKLVPRSTEEARRERFEQEVAAQHATAVRTAEALRKIVLFDSPDCKRTEIADFKKGQIDPQVQLALMARDEFLAAEDGNTRLGFFKATRDLFLNVDAKTLEVLKIAMGERHHREKLAAQERRDNLAEPTDAEIEEALKGQDAPQVDA